MPRRNLARPAEADQEEDPLSRSCEVETTPPSRSSAQAHIHTFSKLIPIVDLNMKCTRALTFENFCLGDAAETSG